MTQKTGLGVLGLASGSVVAGEVLLTRLLSVCTWYGLAFLVLSIAMLGTTQGALAASRAQAEGQRLEPWIARRLVVLSLGLVLTTVVSVSVPLAFYPDVTSLTSVVLVVAAATVPMAAGGGVAARLMAELPVPVSTAYGVDLVCAALGALAPLALVGPLSGPSALIAIGAMAAIAAYLVDCKASASYAFALCAGLVLVTELTSHGVIVRYPKGKPRPEETLAFESWNPLSYVALSSFSLQPFSVWSPGINFRPRNYLMAGALIDGEAGTVVYAYPGAKHIDCLAQLSEDGTAMAHVIRPTGTSCVMGVGGGRDLEAALLAGHDRVRGFEINPAMVAMLHHVHDKSPVLDDSRVEVTLGDARTELAQSDAQCRVLQASLVDTWAATSAGAFAHTEATLYTLEAWSLFLKRVEPDGVLTFSRWYEPTKPSETSRLVALAVGALLQRGVARPRDHVALIAGGLVATILVSPAPFSTTTSPSSRRPCSNAGFSRSSSRASRLMASCSIPSSTPRTSRRWPRSATPRRSTPRRRPTTGRSSSSSSRPARGCTRSPCCGASTETAEACWRATSRLRSSSSWRASRASSWRRRCSDPRWCARCATATSRCRAARPPSTSRASERASC